jgi:uncharacterized membrane protein YhaH (DUF805 family)
MFQKPFSFKGRIRRTEYGLSMIVYVVIVVIDSFIITKFKALVPVFLLVHLALFWFILAQGAKRCHDRGNSGWFQLIPFYVIWMLFAESVHGINIYGLNPKGLGNDEPFVNNQKQKSTIPSAKIEPEQRYDPQQIKEIHIYIEGFGNANDGLTIVNSLRPACLTQRIKPKIIMHSVGVWPEDINLYAYANLRGQGINLSQTNGLVENGSAFGRKIYVLYLK